MEIGISGSETLPRPRPPSWSRLSAVLSTLALVAVMGGSSPLIGDGTESAADTGAADSWADASRWSPLPAGFLPGDGRILIERDGTVLRADFPKSFDVVGHQETRVRIGGDLSFSLVGRGDGGAGATLTILRLGTPGDRIARDAQIADNWCFGRRLHFGVWCMGSLRRDGSLSCPFSLR